MDAEKEHFNNLLNLGNFALSSLETQFKTKGDANPDEDSYWTLEEYVHGQILHRIPYLGWMALDPAIPMAIFITLLIVMILWPEKRRKLRR